MPARRAESTEGDASPSDPTQLPPGIKLAWGLNDRGTRGPKPGLTLERVVAAGIKVALTDGIGALSMGRIAAELGVATMSLYRYVSSKDELLTLMVDKALGTPPPADDAKDWRSGLTQWALGIHRAYRRHPWGLRVPISGPPLGPNNVAWLESALASLAQTPLSEQEKLSTVLLLSGFVRNEATLTADIAAASAGGWPPPSYGSLLAQLTDAEHYPAIHRVIASGAFDDDDGGDLSGEFDYGLNRILDGIDALIRRAPRSRRAPHRPGPPGA